MADFKEIQIGADGQVYQVKDETARNNADGGDGTVKGVKMNNGSPIEPDGDGVVDLGTVVTQHQDITGKANKSEMSVVDGTGTDADKITITLKDGTSATVLKEHQDISGKVDKVDGKGLSTNDYTDADKTKLQNLPTADQLTQQLGSKANDNAVVKGISVNGTAQTKDGQGNVNIQVQAGDQVSVIQPDPADGTFIIRVGSTDYTINLNHTHEGMAKLEKVTEATLPQTLENDTIYVQVDNLNRPTEIESLWLFGLEFAGGGAAPGIPRLTSPTPSQISSGIDIGRTTSGTVSYDLKIKAKDLTQSLLVEWGSGSTGYSFDTSDLPTGVTYDSGTGKLTITKEAACSVNGVDITVVYTGSDTDENAEGTIGISSSSVDGINVEVTLVANKVVYEDLAGVKLTGTQWLQTDYHPRTATQFTMKVKFDDNANSNIVSSSVGRYILSCPQNNSDGGSERFVLYHGENVMLGSSVYKGSSSLCFINKTSISDAGSNQQIKYSDTDGEKASFLTDESIIQFVNVSDSNNGGQLSFKPGGATGKNVTTSHKWYMMQSPMKIGASINGVIYNAFNLTIYELTFEDNNTSRHYVPKSKNGVPGLYETNTGAFITSETAKTSGLASDELVAIPLDPNS